MLSIERQRVILNRLEKNNKVTVKELADLLNVSSVTVRKDLDDLESKGMLIRTFGGAVKADYLNPNIIYDDKQFTNKEKKKEIAIKSEKYLAFEEVLFLDAGTTVFELAKKYELFRDKSVVTYDVSIGLEVARNKSAEVSLLGGIVDSELNILGGIETYTLLENRNFDLAVLACDAIDEHGAYSHSINRSKLKEKAIKNSRNSILLTDSSKINKKSNHMFSDLKNIDFIIMENDADLTELEMFTDKII